MNHKNAPTAGGGGPQPIHEYSQEVGRKERRKLKARSRLHSSVWFGLGMFGLVGWSVAIPAVLGIALGIWLDRAFPSRLSWTLTLLIAGLVLGCLNAWYWIKRERSQD